MGWRVIAPARKPQAIRLLSPCAATQRLAARLATGLLIVVVSYLLVITGLEIAALVSRMS